ncbi:hypothetical protein BTVI_35048 [Pitangus sulphuratus]|nr:hypothetical protein BTVI_35048 [Pitangus sulphuratus]
MEAQGSRRRQLPVLLLWVNGLMTLGFAGARQRTDLCNESLMLEKLPACGKSFEEMMKKVDSKKWCNLTEFIIKRTLFQNSTLYEIALFKCKVICPIEPADETVGTSPNCCGFSNVTYSGQATSSAILSEPVDGSR